MALLIWGRILVDGEPLDQHFEGRIAESFVVSDPFTPSDPDAPVAVLTSSFTVSAAESVVVAFKGRSHTAFFGEPTGGLATGVVNFRLPDGAVLNVSAGYAVDRDGHRYEQAIQPDERFLYLPDLADDAALERATEWSRTSRHVSLHECQSVSSKRRMSDGCSRATNGRSRLNG